MKVQRLHAAEWVMDCCGTVPPSADETIRGAVAPFRQARAAVQARLTGQAPRLADPFGDELRVTASADGTRIGSRGPDGDFASDRYRIELTP